MRNGLREAAKLRGHWAGIPMPLEGESLVVEPKYPHAEALMRMCGEKPDEPDSDPDPDMVGAKVKNTFYSAHKRCDVVVIEKANGRTTFGVRPAMHHLQHDMRTLGCSDAWGIEQESKALELLGTLLEHHRFKQYLLTGMFIERSKRSGVFYMFRKLKPTVAIIPEGMKTRILCTLCLHPIAYYQGSWAGAMCPTDDVIGALMMMRGAEELLWKRANQHPAWRPEAGL